MNAPRAWAWIGAAAALFSAFFWPRMLTHDSTVVLRDLYDGNATVLSLNIREPPGWTPGVPLVLAPGESGHLVYDISHPPDAQITASISVAEISGLDATARVLWQVDGVPGEARFELQPGANAVDLTPHIPPTGLMRLALEARMPLGAPPRAAFERLVVTQRFPRALHWGALIFLFVAGALIWVGVPTLILSELRAARSRGPFALPRWAVLASTATVGVLLLLPHHAAEEGGDESLIFGKKLFDDSRAISNAALLIANGGDTSQLFFRSRERPAFAAHTIPLCLLFPQRFIRATHAPSDFGAQIWREFDRADKTFGSFRNLEISLVAWLEGIACVLIWALIWQRLGCGAGASWIAALLAAVAYTLVLAAPNQISAIVTLNWNMLINAAAMLASIRLLDRPRLESALAAGFMLGLAALTKPTVAATALPLALFAVGRLASLRGPERRSLLIGIGVAVLTATALVLWWFNGMMDGLITELRRHPDDFTRIMELHPEFPRRSWSTAAHALWVLAGPGWLLVLLGLARARRPAVTADASPSPHRWHVTRQARTLALLWAVAGLLAFLMPFIFPRFLKYMAPGLGLIAAVPIAALIQCRRVGHQPTVSK
jgi:hypothetical protein